METRSSNITHKSTKDERRTTKVTKRKEKSQIEEDREHGGETHILHIFPGVWTGNADSRRTGEIKAEEGICPFVEYHKLTITTILSRDTAY